MKVHLKTMTYMVKVLYIILIILKKLKEYLIINEITEILDNVIIYNNYCYLICEGEIKDGTYNGKGIEYSNCIENLILHKGFFINNYYIAPDFNFNNKSVKVVLVSEGWAGKTYLFNRLTENYYLEYPPISVDSMFKILKFDFKYNKYEIEIRYNIDHNKDRSNSFIFMKDAEIVIYIIDLTKLEGIDENFFKEIKLLLSEETLKYLVGIKLDLVEENNKYRYNLMRYKKS